MAVRHFATNNLVESHDNYVKFMKKRAEYFKDKKFENSDVLFFRKGIVCEVFNTSTVHGNSNLNRFDRDITLWHCITIAYDIWSKYACKYIDTKHSSSVSYKLFVDIPDEVLEKIKIEFNQAIANAKCDYAKYTNRCADLTICRYLARFWTYLDIIKDTTTQRFFPNAETCFRAVKIFGYKTGDNPFIMNGKFLYTARRNADKKEEEKPVEETTKYNLNLDASIDEFDFTTRTRNGLWRAGYRKLGDIINLKYENLIKIRNLGLISTREILEKLNEIRSQSESETKEESVIDIAEQAAKEVEEERKSLEYDFATCKIIGKNEYAKLSNIGSIYDELNKKHEELLKTAQKQADMYDELLKQKLELDAYIPRLKEDIATLKEKNEELKVENSKLRIASVPKNLDTFALLNTVLEKMKDSKMEYILLTIDGMTIDIHPAKSFPIKSAYQIRSSER